MKVSITVSMAKLYQVWFLKCLLIALVITVTTGETQKFAMYESNDCSEKSETFTNTATGLGSTWVGEGALSFNVTGLWKLTGSRITSIPDILTKIYEKTQPNCYQKSKEDLKTHTIIKVERIGPANTASPQLNFYTNTDFDGTPYYTVTDNTTNLTNDPTNSSAVVVSLAQFSNTTWLLYPEVYFNGDPRCLCGNYRYLYDSDESTTPMPPDGFQGYTNIRPNLIVGSVDIDRDGYCKCPTSSDDSSSSLPPIETSTMMGFSGSVDIMRMHSSLYYSIVMLLGRVSVLFLCNNEGAALLS